MCASEGHTFVNLLESTSGPQDRPLPRQSDKEDAAISILGVRTEQTHTSFQVQWNFTKTTSWVMLAVTARPIWSTYIVHASGHVFTLLPTQHGRVCWFHSRERRNDRKHELVLKQNFSKTLDHVDHDENLVTFNRGFFQFHKIIFPTNITGQTYPMFFTSQTATNIPLCVLNAEIFQYKIVLSVPAWSPEVHFQGRTAAERRFDGFGKSQNFPFGISCFKNSQNVETDVQCIFSMKILSLTFFNI